LKFKALIFYILLFSSPFVFAQLQLDNILNPSGLPFLKKSRLIQISSHDTTGGNNDRINILPNKTADIAEIEGPGVITRIWITIDSRDPYFLRRILLRFYWDGEKNPSVEVPVGDFFGTGQEYKHYISQYLGMSSGGYYCYFPMPFQKSAHIEVVNETDLEVYAFYYQIDYQKLEFPLEEDIAYFHAQWNRELRTDKSKNYTVLEAEGEGHFVGLNMCMQGYKGNLWFLEGDEMVFVDGEEKPSVYGTGTEDYFNSGWYFNKGEFYAPYHGLIIKDDSLARISAYRFHITDAVPFKKSFRFSIEHGHGNEETADYSSTAYWYQKEPHKKFPPVPKAALRIPLRAVVPEGLIEAEDLPVSNTNANYKTEDMSGIGPEWSGLKQLKVNLIKEGDSFEIAIPAGGENKFIADVYFTTGPDYGNTDIYYKNKKLGELKGFSREILPGGKIRLEGLIPENEIIELKFASSGKDKNGNGYAAGIDGIKLEPDRTFIPEWLMIGPFPNPRTSDTDRKGLDIVYPPEKEISTAKTYIGADNQEIMWKSEQISKSGAMNLWSKYKPYEHVVAYAHTYIYSPEEQRVPLLIGSDDGIKVFLNDETIFRLLEVRISEPDQDRIIMNLKKGWNSLLLKIENNFGGYAFYARVIDLKNNLRISTYKK